MATETEPVEGKCYTDPFPMLNSPDTCPNKTCVEAGRCGAFPRPDGRGYQKLEPSSGTMIDFEVHNNEVQERNKLIQEARELLTQAREAAKSGSDWKERAELSKGVTAFLNSSKHEKYEHLDPGRKF